jgi:hypothetical protein
MILRPMADGDAAILSCHWLSSIATNPGPPKQSSRSDGTALGRTWSPCALKSRSGA